VVDLSRLRCNNEQCPDRSRLQPAGDGQLRCEACGAQQHANQAFKPYAAQTGQWLIGGAVVFSAGYTQIDGPARWAVMALAGTVIAYAVVRIIWQARTLRQVR